MADCGVRVRREKPGEDVRSLRFVAGGAQEVFVFGDASESDSGAAEALRQAFEGHKAGTLPRLVGGQGRLRTAAVDPCGDPAEAVHAAARRVARAHAANQRASADGLASNIVLANLTVAHNDWRCPSSGSCGGSDAGFQRTAALRIANGVNISVENVAVEHTVSPTALRSPLLAILRLSLRWRCVAGQLRRRAADRAFVTVVVGNRPQR